ncbi:MAG TPA: hypothetical protein VMW27_04570 [Thermoanaerobaculia bacterium]|nr:hypothetical protein [Thermoanaerobaculia bacterium]
MVRRFGQRVALLSAAAVLVVGGGWFWLRDASAANCPGGKSHGVSINGGPVIQANTQGGILVLPGNTTTTTTGHVVTTLHIEDVYSNGKVEGLGDLDISLDTTRQAPKSTLTSLKPGSALPARQVMQFYPVFTLNGEVFQADQPARVENSNVDSFPPRPGTVYVLTNAMTLRSDEGNVMTLEPGKAFTVGG